MQMSTLLIPRLNAVIINLGSISMSPLRRDVWRVNSPTAIHRLLKLKLYNIPLLQLITDWLCKLIVHRIISLWKTFFNTKHLYATHSRVPTYFQSLTFDIRSTTFYKHSICVRHITILNVSTLSFVINFT